MENYVTRASVWHHEASLICYGFICGSNAGKMNEASNIRIKFNQ